MKRTIYEEDHEAFRSSVREFLDRQVKPHLEEYVAAKSMPREFWLEAGKQGFLGLEIPDQYGGSEADDYRFNAVLTEELAKVNMALAVVRGHPRRHRGAVPGPPHQRRAEAALAARVLLGRDPHRDRHDRAVRRLGPGCAEDHRRQGRRQLGHQRVQDLHHQRLLAPT